MPRVAFTPQLQRFLDVPAMDVPGTTVREALDAAFARNPRLRDYVVDEHGRVRKHVAIYVDNVALVDRQGLGDAVGADTEIFVLQALSGGSGPAGWETPS